MGADHQSFLFLKCNKSIRELGGEQPGFWRPCCPGHLRLCPERHYNLGEVRGRGGGVVTGGVGAAPVGATLFSPFLINQSWVHHSPAPICWCRFWVPPVGLLGPGSRAGGGRTAPVLECVPGYVPLVPPRDTGRLPLPYVCPRTQTSHSSGVRSSSQVPFFGGTQPIECSPASGLASLSDKCGAQVQRSVLCPFTHGSRSKHQPIPGGPGSLVGVCPGAQVSATGAGGGLLSLVRMCRGCSRGLARGAFLGTLTFTLQKTTPKGNASHRSFLQCKGDGQGVGGGSGETMRITVSPARKPCYHSAAVTNPAICVPSRPGVSRPRFALQSLAAVCVDRSPEHPQLGKPLASAPAHPAGSGGGACMAPGSVTEYAVGPSAPFLVTLGSIRLASR